MVLYCISNELVSAFYRIVLKLIFGLKFWSKKEIEVRKKVFLEVLYNILFYNITVSY